MTSEIVDQLLAANRDFASGYRSPGGAPPSRHLAVVTCMDVRIDPLAALGLEVGQAHIIRNAGGRVTDDALRSLALSVKALGARAVVVIQHTQCGAAGVTQAELEERTGAVIDFHPIGDHDEVLRNDVDLLMDTPYLQPVEVAAGLLFDVETGVVSERVRRQRSQP